MTSLTSWQLTPIPKASVHIITLRQDCLVKLSIIFFLTMELVPLKNMSTSRHLAREGDAPGG